MYDELSPKQIRYDLLTLLIATKPSNTKASTIIKIVDEYYDCIMRHEGEVIELEFVSEFEL